MFQKLIRERPAIQEYWKDLLEKGSIGTEKGSITLRLRHCGDRSFVVRDIENDILFHTTSGRLDVTRAISTTPNKYSFRVSKMGDLDPDDLDPAFDKFEGFEIAIRDLYRAVDSITEEYGKTTPPERRVRSWLKQAGNSSFLLATVGYILLTLIVIFAA